MTSSLATAAATDAEPRLRAAAASSGCCSAA